MRLPTEFLQLPLRFDASRLQAEVAALPEAAWRPHPQGFAGNAALALVSRDGDSNDDRTWGEMRATRWLAALPCPKP